MCAVFCLGVGWAVFVFVPRGTGAGFFGRTGGEGQRNVSGFTNQIELTSNTRIEPSEVPVMHVALERDGRPVGSNGEGLLLRGMVLDRYDPITRRWDRGNTKYSDWSLSTHYPEGLLGQINSEDVAKTSRLVHRITLRVATRGVTVFSTAHGRSPSIVLNTVVFNPCRTRFFRLQRPTGAVDYIIESIEMDPGAPGLMYRTPPGWQSLGWDTYARGAVLADPRLAQLTQTVLAQANLTRDPALLDDPQDHRRAAVIEDYLRNNYKYDLELGSARSDPMLAFLFEHRRGHCEYFASAMCALLRSVGVRARMISGFSASEHNAVGGYYVVRQKNAHAWIEVWANGGGWRAFDPSPPGDVAAIHRAGGGMMAGVRDLYEYLEFYWINSVIRYDNDQRQGVVAGLRDRVKTAASWGREQFDQWLAWLRQAGWMQLLFMISVVAAAGVSFAAAWHDWLQRRMLRRLGLIKVSDRSQRRRLAGELAFYVRMMKRLRALGHERASGQTPAAFAREVAAREPESLGMVVPLTELYYAIRFGGQTLNEAQIQFVRDGLTSLSRPVS